MKDIQPEDLLKYGLIPEFIGRLPIIASLEDLDEKALVNILTEPKNALVKQYVALFNMEDVKLTITDDALAAIARKAIERKSGARGLRAIMEEKLLELMYDIPDKKEVAEIIIDGDVIDGKKTPILVYKEDQKRRCRRGIGQRYKRTAEIFPERTDFRRLFLALRHRQNNRKDKEKK